MWNVVVMVQFQMYISLPAHRFRCSIGTISIDDERTTTLCTEIGGLIITSNSHNTTCESFSYRELKVFLCNSLDTLWLEDQLEMKTTTTSYAHYIKNANVEPINLKPYKKMRVLTHPTWRPEQNRIEETSLIAENTWNQSSNVQVSYMKSNP